VCTVWSVKTRKNREISFSFRFDHDLKNPRDSINVQCAKVTLLTVDIAGAGIDPAEVGPGAGHRPHAGAHHHHRHQLLRSPGGWSQHPVNFFEYL
jgi:hypothetical protein